MADKPINRLLITNVLTLILSLLFGIMALQDKFVHPQYHRLAFFILILTAVVAAAFIATLYIREAVADYGVQNLALKTSLEADRSLQAIPQYIRVTERTDRLVIDENGNATLEWRFLVTGLEKSNTRSLELQIYSEHQHADSPFSQSSFKSNIDILEMSVAGQTIETASEAYTTMELRYPFGGEHPMEFGILRVPTDLGNIDALPVTEIRMKMRLRDTFFRAGEGDFFVVEIPQLTNKISVVLESESKDHKVVVPPASWGEKIKAQMGHSGTLDTSETSLQGARVHEADGKIMWTTEYPKVGYRYLLSFRLFRQNQKTEANQEAAGRSADRSD